LSQPNQVVILVTTQLPSIMTISPHAMLHKPVNR
jgi:hypothetical protein